MTFKKTVFALLCSALLSTSTFASADKAISAAEAAQKVAAKVGYEWRDTGKMIKQAKKLAKEGKTEQAVKLARKAEQQGHSALTQYKAESARYKQNMQ